MAGFPPLIQVRDDHILNAEADSMGGIVDEGAGIAIKTSPRQAAIEKAQAELRQEYDLRDRRRRELEFLEKGGNPLNFKFGNAASVSIQSTSLIDRHKEQFLSGEVKVSLALTASTHGDSIESNDRPGVTTTCEHNSADSHLHFDGGTEVPEGDKKFLRLDRKNSIVHPDQSVKTDSNLSAKESEDSAIFRPYARRNRSRLNRDSGRSSSTDLLNYRASHGSSLPARSLIKDSRVSTLESSDQKEQNPCSVSQAELPDNDNGLLSKSITPETCLGIEVDVPSLESSISLKKTELLDVRLDTARRLDQRAECLTDTLETSADVPCKGIGLSGAIESEVSADACNLPSATSIKADPEMSGQMKSVNETVVNDKATVNEALNSKVATNSKALDSESSCACSTEEMHIDPMNIDQQTVRVDDIGLARAENVANGETANGQIDNVQLKGGADGKEDNMLWRQNCIDNVMTDRGENRSHSSSTFGNEEHTPVEPKREEIELLADNTNMNEEICSDMKPNGPTEEATSESCKSIPPVRVEVTDHEVPSADCHSKLAAIVNEDSVMEEAKIIEAKRKRIAELSIGTVSFEERHRSRWEFVLEEMAWLANDFAQERLWKSTAASQLCRRAASASRLRLKKQNMQINHKKVAFTLAKDVMQFWGSMANNLNAGGGNGSSDGKVLRDEPVDSGRDVDVEGSSGKVDPDTGQELGNNVSLQSHIKLPLLQSYAVRFLRQTNSHVPSFHAQSPEIVDVTSESDSRQVSWGDHLTEKNLFYTIPSGAMETYRKLIESYISQHEGTGNGNIQGANNTHTLEVCDYGYLENAHNEGEGETGAYYLPGAFEGSKSLQLSHKKRKATTRPYELEADSPYGRCSVGTQLPMGKRPTNFVGQIPTKRFRSASRPRVILPSGTASSVRGFPASTKNDASSGDTSSFQDDQSVIPSALRIQKCGEVNSFGDYGSRLSHDMAETSTKTKKKKKLKYTGSQFEQDWQVDSPMLAEQWDQSKRRSENHHFESNGTSGLHAQPVIKKPKIMKHSADNSFDNIVTGSIPSPMASQSMSIPKKILKIFNGRDGGRKEKTLKTRSVQPGSGSSWSQFEDQALVVLVHDMGPNWELVSDAINSILQLKCVYRKSAECKEHHKVLMDKTANDGADSTEDSGSSQSYPSTLPGIPKGSARQLFQRLQGPVEEDVMREHFNKIIQIGQKQRCYKMQNECHDVKQMAVHNSHFVALSQVCPNNLNGVVLTPLDLCEDASANADILLPLGYQGSHGNSVAATNQGSVASALSNSGAYPSLPGSCGPVCSPNLLLPSAPHNSPSRDGRYHVQRPSTPLSDEQHRCQQHGHAPPNRNIQQSRLSVSGPVSGNDRGICTFPNGNNIGIPTATNRSISTSRPAFQGLTGPQAMNPGSMMSSGLVGALSSENLHMGSNSGQGTQLMRPREALHSARQPGNSEHQRQMMAPEMQMQVAQGNTHGIPAVNGMGSVFSNQATSPVSTFSAHSQTQHQNPPQQSSTHNHHQNTQVQGTNHSTGPHSQAYAIRLAKERQLQQRYMQQHQQQQLASSGSLMSHAQPPPQLPLSSALANSAQIPLQSPAPPVLSAPLTPSSPINPMTPAHAQKVPMQASGVVRNAQSGVAGITIQVGKQRQHQLQQQQQFQQSGRQHPEQQHSTQAPAKVPRGGGRGNAMVHQNLPNESSQSNGISITPGSSVGEKELMRGQGIPSLTSMRPVQQSKPLASQPLNHPQVSLQTSSDMAPHLKQCQQQHQPHTSGQILHHSNSSTPMASNHLEVQAPQLTNKRQFPLTQSTGARMVPQTQVTHEPLIESQLDCKGDADSVSNTLMVGTSKGMPLASHVSAGSPPIRWQASEPLYEAGIMSATGQMGRGGNLAFSGPVRSDSLPSVNQGLGQRQKSHLSSSHGQGTGVVEEERPMQNTPLKHSSALSPPPLQQYRAGEQVLELEQLPSKEQPLHSQPHHQTPHLLASQRKSCTRQANSDVE